MNHYRSSTRWVERFGREHPEYFAVYPGGTRSHVDRAHDGHLCYTGPGVIRESVADIRAFLAGKPSEARGISRIHPVTKKPTNEDNRGWPEHIAHGGHFSLLPHDGFGACQCERCVIVGFCAFSHPASLYYRDTFRQYEDLVRQWASLTHGNMAFWQHYLASNRRRRRRAKAARGSSSSYGWPRV